MKIAILLLSAALFPAWLLREKIRRKRKAGRT